MGQAFQIRLGGVEVVYDARQGLILHDAHDPRTELIICEADLPDLMEFVCRHNPTARQAAAALPAPHWDRPTANPDPSAAP